MNRSPGIHVSQCLSSIHAAINPAIVRLVTVLCGAALLVLAPATHAANLLTTNVQASGANWTGAIWKTNNGAGVPMGTAVAPVAGNTYSLIYNGVLVGNGVANTRIRPPTSGNATFPGDSLTMQTNTEMRFKVGSIGNIMNFPGVGGNPGLILNGGMINGGDDATYPLRGYVRVTFPSFISHGANGGAGGISPNRAVDFQGVVDGTASLEIINAGTTIPQIVSGNNNTFSGQWIVQCGWLQGNGANSLGTNSITVDPLDTTYLNVMPNAASPQGPAWFEVGYDINSAGTLTLNNGGQMRLHQNCTFAAVNIEGHALPPGTHTYSDLTNNYNFNNNFSPNSYYGTITVQPYGTPPLIIPQFITQPVPETLYSGQTATFSGSVLGSQLTYQWLQDGVPMTDGGNISGSLTATLTISGATVANVAAYSLIVSNSAGAITSAPPAALSITQPGDPTDLAVVSHGAIIYYPLDEQGDPLTNTYCFDVLSGKTGTYGIGAQNGFNNVAGPRPTDGFPYFSSTNSAAQFTTGVSNSWITLPPLNLNTNALTITAWINPAAVQLPNEGIVFSRSGSTVAGLVMGTNLFVPTLGYNWNNNASTYNFNSGITVPTVQWSFVGLVISPTNATLYLINTNSFLTAVNTFTNPPLAFSGTTLIGDDIQDNTTFSRIFNGAIDNVALYPASLNISQIIDLYASASGVSNFPVNIVTPPQSLAVYDGQAASFSVLASGPSLAYQWQAAPTGSGGPYTNLANGGKFSGVTSAILTIANVTNVNALDYVVVVSNASGSITNTDFSPATLSVLPVGPPEAITMACQEASGNDWDIGSCWSDGNAASISAVANLGSTYEVLPGALLRTPQNLTYSPFPTTNLAYAPPLTVDGNGVFINNPGTGTPQAQIKFKGNIATGATNFFPKLVLNGGQLDNAGSPSGPWIIQGELDVVGNGIIYVDSAGGTGRPFRIDSWLNGNSTSSIEYHDFDNSFSADLNITGPTNAYKGTWNVVVGALLGSGTNSLGTNSITVGANGDLETTYNINSPNATLFLYGQMLLHQNDTFGSMYVNSVPVPAGTYTYAQLAAAYPTSFPATWTLLPGSVTNRASGSITVKTTGAPLPITFGPGLGVAASADSSVGAPVTYSASVAGGTPPFSYQWYLNGAPVAGATNGTFAFPGSAGSNSLFVVVMNGGVPATNGPASIVVTPVGPIISFADTNNWILQGTGITPQFSTDPLGSNFLSLTTDAINEAASAFYRIGQYIGGFNASFVYSPSNSDLTIGADGLTFCLQNSPQGAAALGTGGGNLGYVGINNSVVVAVNIFAANTNGIGFASGGGVAPSYMSTPPVNLASGSPITVQISWAGNLLTTNGFVPSPIQVTLTDTNANQFTTNYLLGDLVSLIGDSVAYVGFTAATGGSSAAQEIDNFSFQFNAPPVLSASASGTGNIAIQWPAGALSAYHLQEGPTVVGPWTNIVTVPTIVNGYKQIVAPANGSTAFFQLISP